MKFNKWTLGLAAVGAVSMASAVRADEAPKMSQLNTALSNTTISGYVDVAAQYNPGDAGGTTTPVNYTGKPGHVDGFSLNVVDITLDKPQDESPWASGYHIDLNAGPNEIDGLQGSHSTESHMAIRQAYVALRTPVGNGIDWKFGVFDGVTGYEGNTSYANPNYTRSYGWQVNPASEIGLIGSYKICNEVTVQAGLADRDSLSGTPSGASPEASSKAYIVAAALTAPDSWGWFKGSTLNLGTVQTFDNYGINNYNASLTMNTPVAGLKGGLSYDKVQVLNQNAGDGNIYGVYASFQQTDKLSYNLRGEYLDGQNLGFFSPTVFPGKGEEVTVTVEYDLWANVTSRVEGRWDHFENGTPFNNNNTENAFLLALNVVYKF